MTPVGFDNDKYLEEQSRAILDRAAQFDNKLYLEFGGKLAQDCHAARILPGFDPNVKLRLLQKLKEKIDIVICIYAGDIERKKIRADFGISYDADTLRIIDMLRSLDISVRAVVVTRYAGQPAVKAFINKLTRFGIRVYTHRAIPGYPTDLDMIVSDEGYGSNAYIETERPIVIVTGPGPSSGKMATCLSQVYHEQKRGIRAGYAKFETFPVWNLPLKHPVNLAYEAATADLADVNMIDPFHLEAYGATAVNYNRDVEVFPVLRAMLEQILGECPYKSPTDMGVNMAGNCIFDNDAVSNAAKQEIIRRYYNALCRMRKDGGAETEIEKIELLMRKLSCSPTLDRPVVNAALARASETAAPAVAIELNDGRVVTGKTTSLLGASSAALLNALKALAGIDKEEDIISPEILAPIQVLKTENLGNHNPRLHTDEVLIALAISAANSESADKAMKALPALAHAEVHSTVILSEVDASTFRKLGMQLSCEPQYQTKKLFHR